MFEFFLQLPAIVGGAQSAASPESAWLALAAIALLAFLCEFVDSSIGMGYGTTIVPALLLLGFNPLAVIPAVLISQTSAGFAAAFFHHKEGNVNFSKGERDLKIALLLAGLGAIGAIAAVALALNLPKATIEAYIGLVVAGTGVLLLVRNRLKMAFSWWKIGAVGAIAAANKGLSGGGYGPLVVTGQLLSGIKSKNAIGITALSEAIVSISAIAAYLWLGKSLDLSIAGAMVLGALLSVPFSAKAVKKLEAEHLALAIGLFAIILGLATIWKAVAS